MSNGRGVHPTTVPIDWKVLVMMIVRVTILVITTVTALYIRWLVMGSTLPVFQETDNPTSFENDFYTRVSTVQALFNRN